MQVGIQRGYAPVQFDEYVRRRLPSLLRTACAITTDAYLAEELVQDVLVKAGQAWERLRLLDDVDAYVRRMIVNEHISWRRKWSRQVLSRDIPDAAVDDHAEPYAERDLLRRQVAALPKRQQVALALRYFDDLPDDAIAAALDCSEATVRSYISRGLARLRVQLDAADPTAALGELR